LTAKRDVVQGERTIQIPVLDDRWKVKLGESTFNWLNDALAAMKLPGNAMAHGRKANFDQFESQMIQAITTTLIAYAARSENVNP
jgi:hypothetical protein